MEKTQLGVKFLKMSAVYFIVGITMGALMTIKPIHDFALLSPLIKGAHSHITLLGWLSFMVIGIYYLLPIDKKPINEKRANLSFWLLNIGVAAMYLLLLIAGYISASMIQAGDIAGIDAAIAPFMILVMVSAFMIAIGAYLFAIEFFKSLCEC